MSAPRLQRDILGVDPNHPKVTHTCQSYETGGIPFNSSAALSGCVQTPFSRGGAYQYQTLTPGTNVLQSYTTDHCYDPSKTQGNYGNRHVHWPDLQSQGAPLVTKGPKQGPPKAVRTTQPSYNGASTAPKRPRSRQVLQAPAMTAPNQCGPFNSPTNVHGSSFSSVSEQQQSATWPTRNPNVNPCRGRNACTGAQTFVDDLSLLGNGVDSILGMSLSDSAIDVLPHVSQCNHQAKFQGNSSLSSCELRGPCVPLLLNHGSHRLPYIPPKRPETLSEAAAMYIDYLIHENENLVLISKCDSFRPVNDFDHKAFLDEVLEGPCQMPSENFRAWLKQFNVDVEVVTGDIPTPDGHVPRQYADFPDNCSTVTPAANPPVLYQYPDTNASQKTPNWSFIDDAGNEIFIKQSLSSMSLPTDKPDQSHSDQELFTNMMQDQSNFEFLLQDGKALIPSGSSVEVSLGSTAGYPTTSCVPGPVLSYSPRQSYLPCSTSTSTHIHTPMNNAQVQSANQTEKHATNPTGNGALGVEPFIHLHDYQHQVPGAKRRRNGTCIPYTKPDNFVMVSSNQVHPQKSMESHPSPAPDAQAFPNNSVLCYLGNVSEDLSAGEGNPSVGTGQCSTSQSLPHAESGEKQLHNCFRGYAPAANPNVHLHGNTVINASQVESESVAVQWESGGKANGGQHLVNCENSQPEFEPQQELELQESHTEPRTQGSSVKQAPLEQQQLGSTEGQSKIGVEDLHEIQEGHGASAEKTQEDHMQTSEQPDHPVHSSSPSGSYTEDNTSYPTVKPDGIGTIPELQGIEEQTEKGELDSLGSERSLCEDLVRANLQPADPNPDGPLTTSPHPEPQEESRDGLQFKENTPHHG